MSEPFYDLTAPREDHPAPGAAPPSHQAMPHGQGYQTPAQSYGSRGWPSIQTPFHPAGGQISAELAPWGHPTSPAWPATAPPAAQPAWYQPYDFPRPWSAGQAHAAPATAPPFHPGTWPQEEVGSAQPPAADGGSGAPPTAAADRAAVHHAEAAALRAELARERAEADAARVRAAAEAAALRHELERAHLQTRLAAAEAGSPPPTSEASPHARGRATGGARRARGAHDDDGGGGDGAPSGADDEEDEGKLRPLPTGTTTALRARGTLEPDRVPAFLRLFKHRVARHDARVKTLVAAGAPGSDPALLAADEWLAGALVDCLDDASAHVANLIDSVADADLESGTRMLSIIGERCELTLGAQRRAAEVAFQDLAPLKVGMAPELVEQACNDLVAKFKRLKRYDPADPLAVRAMLIKKMPEGVHKERDELEDKLYEADIRAASDAERLVAPWSLPQLVQIIALKLRARPRAHVADVGRRGDGKPQPAGGDPRCEACGQAGHSARECSRRCPSCGLKNCPGTYGGAPACVIAPATRPSNVQNARGKKVARVIYDQLIAEWAKRHPTAAAADAAADASAADAAPQPVAAAAAADAQMSEPFYDLTAPREDHPAPGAAPPSHQAMPQGRGYQTPAQS